MEAANTKWNFNNYTPGLVGGHCIGVDPYYLAYKAKKITSAIDVNKIAFYKSDKYWEKIIA